MQIKVYLDYANWISLSRDPQQFYYFERAIRNELIQPVISFTHIIEIANSGVIAKDEMACFLDRVNDIKPLIWIKGLSQVIRLEILAQYKSWLLKIPVSAINPFGASLVDVLSNQEIYLFDKDVARRYSIKEIVDLVGQMEGFSSHKKFKGEYPCKVKWVSEIRKNRKQVKFKPEEVKNWIISLLPDSFESPGGILSKISPENKIKFADEIDLKACPAFMAKISFYEGQNSSPEGVKSSSIADHFHLVGVSYCNISFVDKYTYSLLKNGNVENLPYKNGQFKDWVNTLETHNVR